MKTYVEDGETVVVTAPEAVDSGEFIKVGELYGVAPAAADNGASVVLKRRGVFTLPKTTSQVWTQGQKVFWNASTKKFTNDPAQTPIAAIVFADAGSSDTTAKILIGGPDMKMAFGLSTTVAASDTIVTGLSKLLGVVAGLNDAPTDAISWVNADIGDQAGTPAAGSFLLKSWKNTSGSDPTPLAATAFGVKVPWIAFGY